MLLRSEDSDIVTGMFLVEMQVEQQAHHRLWTNVIEGIKSNNVSVVLQHDIKNFSVDAVEQIIEWGLSEGYTFLPITSTTPMSHHGVNN